MGGEARVIESVSSCFIFKLQVAFIIQSRCPVLRLLKSGITHVNIEQAIGIDIRHDHTGTPSLFCFEAGFSEISSN